MSISLNYVVWTWYIKGSIPIRWSMNGLTNIHMTGKKGSQPCSKVLLICQGKEFQLDLEDKKI